jgi:hypothetical protein
MRQCRVLLLAAAIALGAGIATAAAPKDVSEREAAITVGARQWGVSTRYIGGTEGDRRFDIADLTDCGVNTLRIYGDMSRFEPVDDDGRYGSPSIAEIKANPNVIPWARWDAVMDSPYSPYIRATPPVTWKSMFADLRRAGVRVVLSLRNRDAPTLRPEWMAAVPATEADWNEWWEYVFAIGYWLNVRNGFGVDEYEVLNEPDNSPQQGWLGTREQYAEMVRRTDDALAYLYRTYLPGRVYHLHAPVTAGPAWVAGVLADAGDRFDSLNVHNYAWWDRGAFVREMHRRLAESGHAGYPVWLSEWGTYDVSYDEPYMGLALIENLIRFSQPGDDYVYGSHVFSFYDWTYEGSGHCGIISGEGERRRAYYALRLAVRALAGGKPTFQARASRPDLLAIATKEPDGTVNLLVLNWSETVPYRVSADLSGLLTNGAGVIRQFSADVRDEVVGAAPLTEGRSRFRVPSWSAVLVQYRGEAPRPALRDTPGATAK